MDSEQFLIKIYYNYYKDAYPDEPAVQSRMSVLDSSCPQIVRMLLQIDYNEWCKETKIILIKNDLNN